MSQNRYYEYLSALKKPFQKVARLDFLQPDGSVAFSLGNEYKRGYNTRHDTRAFLQDGTLNVSLQNGQRRKATVTIANADNAFDYNVNNVWFGQRVRLLMGLILPDGTDFLLPQGVFYITDPQEEIQNNNRTISYNLVDKWSYLDGTCFGNLEGVYHISKGVNIFDAMTTILHLSRYNFEAQYPPAADQIDDVKPVFTSYYNDKTYSSDNGDGSVTQNIPMLELPFDVDSSSTGNFAEIILEMNDIIAGLIGYDQTGALRIEPSQYDVEDKDKAILWEFTSRNANLVSLSETLQNTEVYNDVIIAGQSITNAEVWGRAMNFDPKSDTNINLIGRRTYREDNATYWNAEQCKALANWELKRRTMLQKSVTIESTQIFHLMENRLVTVERTDKPGSPVEKHIIQSFTLPIGQTGSMTINATSAQDVPNFTFAMNPDNN